MSCDSDRHIHTDDVESLPMIVVALRHSLAEADKNFDAIRQSNEDLRDERRNLCHRIEDLQFQMNELRAKHQAEVQSLEAKHQAKVLGLEHDKSYWMDQHIQLGERWAGKTEALMSVISMLTGRD